MTLIDATSISPNADDLNRLGVAAAQRADPAMALQWFELALTAAPRDAAAHNNRGAALCQLRQWHKAIASFDEAISIQPNYAEAFFNRGNAWRELDDGPAALQSYDRAIALKPDYAEAYCNRGVVLNDLQLWNSALASFDRAIELQPDYAMAYCNRALTLLLTGDLERGLPLYEWRWKLKEGPAALDSREFSQPQWLGQESLRGRRILVRGEQGFGDTLLFCRYAKVLADGGAEVILEVHKSLISLLADLEGVAQLVAKGSRLPEFDFHCSLASLPLACGTRLGAIPNARAYLISDSGKAAQWRARLGSSSVPRIGLAWSGSGTNRRRRIALSSVIANLPGGMDYVVLQKDLLETDLAALSAFRSLRNFAPELHDFSDTASLCECVDLVISIDTSVAHLSAALGKETWILLPHSADWRWFLERQDSPWYPSVKLYRQRTQGDWEEVLARVAVDLNARVERGEA